MPRTDADRMLRTSDVRPGHREQDRFVTASERSAEDSGNTPGR